MSTEFNWDDPQRNTVVQIRQEAARRGLTVPQRLNKEELLLWLAKEAGKGPIEMEEETGRVSASRSSRTPTPYARPGCLKKYQKCVLWALLTIIFAIVAVYCPNAYWLFWFSLVMLMLYALHC